MKILNGLVEMQATQALFREFENHVYFRKGKPEALIMRCDSPEDHREKLVICGRSLKKEFLLEVRAEIDRLLSFHA